MRNAVKRTFATSTARALSNSSALYRTAAFASLAFVMASASSAHAISDPNFVVGTGTITRPDANTAIITTPNDLAIANFENFNILYGQTVQVVQNSAASTFVGKVVGGQSPTQILGNLIANGKIVLINPNGVFFGAGSRVDVGGLVATTADIDNATFNPNKMIFNRPGRADASIVNKGTITAANGGLVALVAPGVQNDGIIQANMGTVAVGAGSTVAIDMYGDNLYSFAIGKSSSAARDQNGNTLDSAVENNGTLSANGGQVLLSANVAKDIVTNVVNNTGIIEAKSAQVVGGTVVIGGGDSGKVLLAGTIDASGKGAGQTGGSVTVTGEHIELAGVNIDATGSAAGGQVRIGGDYQGGGSLQHARTVTGDAATVINVSAIDSGNAGTAVLWSDDMTQYAGSLLGKGGAIAGNGGLVEVSSESLLDYSGSADVSAVNGEAGTLLLDPLNIVIGNILAFVTQATLNLGGNVTISTPAFGPQAGNITVNSNISWFGIGNLTLNAINNIVLNANITSTNVTGAGSRGGVNLVAGNNVTLNNSTISAARGNVTVTGNKVTLMNSVIASLRGDLVINNSGRFYSDTANALRNQDSLGTGKIWVNQTEDGSIQNALDAIGARGWGGAKVTLADGTWNEQVLINKSNTTLTGQGDTSIINAPEALNSYLSVSGITLTPVIYTDSVVDVTVSNLKVDGDNSANVGIGFKRTFNGQVKDTLITNMNGNGIYLDRARNSVVQRNRIDGTIGRPELEFGSGIHAVGSHNSIIGGDNPADGNDIKNVGWDGIKLEGGNNYSVKNNVIDNSRRVGIYAAGINDTVIAENTTSHNNTSTTGFGAISVFGGSSNITVADNIIRNVVKGSGIMLRGVSGDNFITGNLIHDTQTHGVQVFLTDGVEISGNYIGFLDTLGNESGIDNIQGDGVLVENSNDVLVSTNKITQTKSLPAIEKGSGVHVVDSHRATINGNTITSIGWDGVKIGGGTGHVVQNNTIDNTERVGVYAAGISDALITNNLITRTMNNADGYGAIAIDGGSFGLTITDNEIYNVKKGSGIRLNSVGGYNRIAGNDINSVELDGVEVLNSTNLNVSNNSIVNAERDGIHLETVSNVDVNNNLIHDVDRDGIYANNLYLVNEESYLDSESFFFMPVVGNTYITDNTIYNTGRDGIHLESVQNAYVVDNLIHDVGRHGIYANSLTTTGLPFMVASISAPIEEGDGDWAWMPKGQTQSIIMDNVIYGTGVDGIHLENVNNAYVVDNLIHDICDNGIYAFNLTTDWAVSSVIAANEIFRTGINGININTVNNAYVVDNTIYDVGSSYGHGEGEGEGDYSTKKVISKQDDRGHGIYANNLFTSGYYPDLEMGLVGKTSVNKVYDGEYEEGETTYFGQPGRSVISNNDVFRIQNDGIHLNNVQNAIVTLNEVYEIGNDGIYANNLYTGRGFIDYISDSRSLRPYPFIDELVQTIIANNTVYYTGHDGIHLENIENAFVDSNLVHDLSNDGIFASNLYVSSNIVEWPVLVESEILNDSFEGGEGEEWEPIFTHGETIISNNTVYGVGHDGIHLESIQYAKVINNTVHDVGNDGIYAINFRQQETVDGGDYLDDEMFVKIPVFDYYETSLFDNNVVYNTGDDGMHLEGMTNTQVTNNDVSYNNYAGINLISSNDATVSGNEVYNAAVGLNFLYSQSPVISDNILTDNGIGAQLYVSDNASLSGDIFTGNTLGINLDNSWFTRIENEIITTPEEGVGLRIANGSLGTIVKDTAFNGGNVAVDITDEDSAMQFEGNGSTFTGNNFYFVVQNGAMFGEVLDASQQTFDGTRASDFTPEQLAAAEFGRTIDVEDGFAVGDVFYKFFPVVEGALFDINLLETNENNVRNRYRRGNFSYAGRSLNIIPNAIEFGTFDARNANLSLLGRASPTAAADVANLFATLAPAAGGNNPQDLANLAPAAGGNTPQELASLAPAAGGAGGSCGNSFLGDGYVGGFQCALPQ